MLNVWANLPAIVRVGPLKRRIESSCGHIFLFRDLYYCVFILLVGSLHYLRRWSLPLPWYIHIYVGILLTVWADLPAIVRLGPLRRLIESSCGRIFPVPRLVLSSVYSPFQFLILFTSVICSFSLIHTYICRNIVDCLSQPFSHISSGTFKKAYWILMWSDFARLKTCIIKCVLSWSIPCIFTSLIFSFSSI